MCTSVSSFNLSSAQQSLQQPPPYCTNCEQANRINDGWIIDIQPDCVEYEWPDCVSVIESCFDCDFSNDVRILVIPCVIFTI